MLKMKARCERCDKSLPADSSEALICAFECTFCTSCGDELEHRCPNCSGELVARPRRDPRAILEPASSHAAAATP
jgi:hypothetical protein